MLSLSNLSKRYVDQLVLSAVTFSLQPGEKVGLAGANGSGKSTLLRIIAGEERPDSGSVMRAPDLEVGYMPQQVEASPDQRVGDLLASSRPAWLATRREFEDALASLSNVEPSDHLLETYAEALERFEHLGGYDLEHQMEAIKTGLGIGELPLDQRVASLSGGEKTRLSLGALLLSDANLLLLDEPTNHLDLPALRWLEAFVQSSPQAAIIVSHDREFLDRTVSRILFIDESTHTLTSYPGGYSDFLDARRREREVLEARYRDQEERIERVEREIRSLKNRARKTEQGTINFHYRKIAKGVARRATVQEKRLRRDLASDEHLEKPEYDKRLYLRTLVESGIDDQRLVLAAKGLTAVVDGRTLFADVDLTVRGGDRVWLSGPNGSGKTTLLEMLAGVRPGDGDVELGADVTIGYLRQEHLRSEVANEMTALEAARLAGPGEESAIRAVLDQFLFTGRDVLKEVRHLSYGERLRLELARLVIGGANVLLLDEPTNHLDLPAIERLQAALEAYAGPLVVVSHDRAFIAGLGLTTEWRIEHGEVKPLAFERASPSQLLQTV